MVALPHWPIPPWKTLERNSLKEILAILESIDNPHLKLPPVIHVAGTNGKGSTVAMLKAILTEAGYKCHVYTSPHLVEYNERIMLAGEYISDNFLFEILEEVREKTKNLDFPATFFEITTAAAFLAFSKVKADIVILETGIGGRLDATNVIPNPLLSIITPISYDHMDLLGNTLPKIAGEKAGIIKPNVSCIISRQEDEVMQVFFSKCEQTKSDATAYAYDFIPEIIDDKFFNFKSQHETIKLNLPNLIGDHQIINASTVVAACKKLSPHFQISDTHLNNGLRNCQILGRLQKFDLNKIITNIPNAIDCWLDGAHNSSGAKTLADWIISRNSGKKTFIILGITKQRDIATFLEPFKIINPMIACVRVKSEATSYVGDILADTAKNEGFDSIAFDDIADAVFYIVNKSKGNADIIITGSLYLVSDCLKVKAPLVMKSNK